MLIGNDDAEDMAIDDGVAEATAGGTLKVVQSGGNASLTAAFTTKRGALIAGAPTNDADIHEFI